MSAFLDLRQTGNAVFALTVSRLYGSARLCFILTPHQNDGDAPSRRIPILIFTSWLPGAFGLALSEIEKAVVPATAAATANREIRESG
jgi:hypothetical protein